MKTGFSLYTSGPEQTRAAGAALAKQLRPGDVVALYGGLGAGKTAFVGGIAQGLGITEPVSSPTFALLQVYRGALPLYHFDMYRVQSWEDLYSTGFLEYLEEPAVLAVEWSEHIENALPECCVKVEIRYTREDTRREIRIDGVANLADFSG